MNISAYPFTRLSNQVDTYHGVAIEDPYRWLEDGSGPEQLVWIAAQNDITRAYLDRLPVRRRLHRRLRELLRFPRWYNLYRRGPYLLYQKNDGLAEQLALYVQQGLTGPPEVLVDPRQWAPDGTVKVISFSLSRDFRYLGYVLSQAGSDWQCVRIKDMHTRRDLEDQVDRVMGGGIAWRGPGFYYSRYPAPATGAAFLFSPREHHQVWYHHVGEPQSADTLVYEDRAHPGRLHFVETTEAEQFVVLSTVNYGEPVLGTALSLLDRDSDPPEWRRLVAGFDGMFSVVDVSEAGFLCLTSRGAPNRRVMQIDPAHPEPSHWREIVSERAYPLERVAAVGGKLFAVYRQDATHRIDVLDRSGALEHEVSLPAPGLVQIFPGQRSDRELLWSFASFTEPVTIYRYDLESRRSTVLFDPEVPFEPGAYRTTQVHYPSTDRTRIPMFLVHRKDVRLDGRNPCLVYGYGGNGLSIGPTFDPLLVALLERGVVLAVPCLRGGGEFGEAWHQAGQRQRKQTVFDDCIAAAEWLHANGYASPDRTALFGASNGGLTVGAVMTQRPELFAVALPAFGIMDMLRFQHFTLGAAWTSEYGSSDDPEMLPVLLAYSPLHNIREGVRYPATLVLTSEADDRVVPAHSFKFAATLQRKAAPPGPYLIRVDQGSGHGAASLPKEIDERADTYAFLLAHLPGWAEPLASPGLSGKR